jgi:hypothetical protein
MSPRPVVRPVMIREPSLDQSEIDDPTGPCG